MKFIVVVSFLLIVGTWPAFANWSNGGEVSFQNRWFKDDHSKATQDVNHALQTKIEIGYESDSTKLKVQALGLVDRHDQNRNELYFEEAYIQRFLDEDQNFTVGLGYYVYNWSTLEAFHPADVVNSRQLDSDLENLEKKGELAAFLEYRLFEGAISLFYWPRYRQSSYPGEKSRIGLGVNVGQQRVVVAKNKANQNYWRPQGGVKLDQTFGPIDVSVHAIHHVDRMMPLIGTHRYNPYVLDTSINIPLETPTNLYYARVNQYGGSLQWAWDRLVIKAEGAYRDFYEEDIVVLTTDGLRTPVDHSEWAIGLEYNFSPFLGLDFTLFLEGQSIFGVDKLDRSRLSAFQRDIFFGTRIAFNDIQGKEVYLGFLKDVERKQETLITLKYSQRLTDQWKVSTGVRIFEARQKETIKRGLEAHHQDHHAYINLSRFL